MSGVRMAPASHLPQIRDVLTGSVVEIVRRPTSNGAPVNVIVVVDGNEVAIVDVNALMAAVREAMS